MDINLSDWWLDPGATLLWQSVSVYYMKEHRKGLRRWKQRSFISDHGEPVWSDKDRWSLKMECLVSNEAEFVKDVEKLGLRATVTLQLPDDTRKVRLLKEGQASDEGVQCEDCKFSVWPWDGEQLFCTAYKTNCGRRDCPEWLYEYASDPPDWQEDDA